jgi:hypothetical protein
VQVLVRVQVRGPRPAFDQELAFVQELALVRALVRLRVLGQAALVGLAVQAARDQGPVRLRVHDPRRGN